MPNIHATISLVIRCDALPPEIPGTVASPDDISEPISGSEQVTYDVFKRIQEILPDNVYGYIDGIAVLEN
jgi:hypothetical protein